MARLVKTQVEMEGRYEDRWVLVEDEQLPAWPANDGLRVVGKPATRVTGPKRVSGAARFVSDVGLPGLLHGVVLRSPYAHAKVELDPEAARAEHGVFAVLTPADGLEQDGRPIFLDEPEFAGQPVAAIAADSVEAGQRALEALVRGWQELPFVIDLE